MKSGIPEEDKRWTRWRSERGDNAADRYSVILVNFRPVDNFQRAWSDFVDEV